MGRVAHLLNGELDVYRRTKTADGQGGFEYTFSLLEAGRPVRLVQATAREQLEAEQAGSSLTHIVYQDADADIERGDEFRSGSASYRVMYVVEPSETDVYTRADVERIQSEPG